MADYKKMYAVLCAAIDGVIDNLDASMIYAYYSGRLEKFPAEKGN